MGGGGRRGVDLFNTYTTAGTPGGETWHPDFNYFGMQWVQVTGLPDGLRADHGHDHRPAAAGAPRRRPAR